MDAPRRIKIRNGYINEPMPYATGGGETLSYILATPEALAASPEVAKLVAEEREAERERCIATIKALWKWDDEGWLVERPNRDQIEPAIRRVAEETGT